MTLIQITLYIAAALILVPLGKRFGIATVLGYLFTGILLGPSVLNIASDHEEIIELAEYGVIMLMFLIGLELRPSRLWKMRQSIFVLGGLQMVITGVVLTGLFLVFLTYSLTLSFVLGFAFALSSTAFVLQLLADREQLKTFYGQQSFAVLLFQDIAAMGLMAIIPILAGHESAHRGLAYFLAVIASFSGLFLFSRYVLRPLFRFVAKSGATELLTAVALFIILGVVVLMDAISISTTLGAFLTGVLLADSEFRHELEASIQPFKGLLLGLFFMTVGMNISLDVLHEQAQFIIVGTLLLMLIKIICVSLIAFFRKHSFLNSLRLGIALSQGGEFAFVIFTLAVSSHIMPADMVAPLSLIVAFSMILTPALFFILDRVIEPLFFRHDKVLKFDDLTHNKTKQRNNHIVIAGFGRVGQLVARIAHLHHFPFTAIDNNMDNVDFVRKYGGKVYYGDATVPEILQSADVDKARLFILAVDDIEDSLRIARHMRLHYPEVTILARARNRHHVYLLRELGVQHVWREIYRSALAIAETMLLELGTSPEKAKYDIQCFLEYDEQLLQHQQGIYSDPQKLLESHRDMLKELQELFENDEVTQKQNPERLNTAEQQKSSPQQDLPESPT